MVSESEPLHTGSGGWIRKELIVWHPSLREKRSIPLFIHNSGGAFQTVQYAKKKNIEIGSVSDQVLTICEFARIL